MAGLGFQQNELNKQLTDEYLDALRRLPHCVILSHQE